MKLLIIYLFLSLTCLFGQAASVTLAWNKSCNVAGYRVYYGPTGTLRTNIYPSMTDGCGVVRPAETNVYHGQYTNNVTVVGETNTTCTISNLVVGATYYFVVTCYDSAGLESDFSNEVGLTIPRPKPRNLRQEANLTTPRIYAILICGKMVLVCRSV